MQDLSREKWNKFIIENNGLFLQSFEWGEFQESLGRKIWRLGDSEKWQALIVRYDLPLSKNYLYCPGGPIINEKLKTKNEEPQYEIQNFLEEATNIAKQEKSIFLKIEPFAEKELGVEPLYRSSTPNIWRKSDGGQRILETLVLDLEKSEEQLLAEMKQKTRYNIKLAQKHGVKIRISENLEKDFESFWQLAGQTSKRDGFGIHAKEYYRTQICADYLRIGTDNTDVKFQLFLAEYEGRVIAANIVVFFGKRAIYLHGASSDDHRNLMAPYLLQWEQIKEAKKLGFKIYDFWGISENKWPGVTRFKKGFGGNIEEYIGTYDYIFDKMWYGIYKIAKKIF
jgi:lipid II:glycine glycyltransferase (peptidoglycan interpeptide bridge formation enzyme)